MLKSLHQILKVMLRLLSKPRVEFANGVNKSITDLTDF